MHEYNCEKCKKDFITRKKGQRFCSKSCANSVSASKRKIEDKSIFQNGIDSFNAYILGLILSDGCISFDNHSKRNRLTIALCDEEIITKLNKRYNVNKKVYHQTPKNGKEIYQFISTNEVDINFLKQNGIWYRKSKILDMPEVELEYVPSLIKGIFDGDGSVYRNNTKSNGKLFTYLNVSITTGSELFALKLNEMLRKYEIKSSIIYDSRSKNVCI
ncbi:MAG: LAGLIDADG family homing endonuclease [Clostridium sp.]